MTDKTVWHRHDDALYADTEYEPDDNSMYISAEEVVYGFDTLSIADKLTVVRSTLYWLQMHSHNQNREMGWWTDLETGGDLADNPLVPYKNIALMHSELSEAVEGLRKDLMDDHLPEYPMITVELADCMIRILDTAGGFNWDVPNALVDKLLYNLTRADHKLVNRVKPNGKKH
jgi:hypothetical protein